MTGFVLTMFVLPAAIIALAVLLARAARLRPAPLAAGEPDGHPGS